MPATCAPPLGSERFHTTHWNGVLAARDADSTDGEAALQRLCGVYWYPLYVYVRRRGYAAADAEDLTQEFFKRLLERNDLGSVSPEKGRFRSFLLASMNHFLANEWDRGKAEKRGGKISFVSLDEECAESRYAKEGVPDLNAQRAFDRRWAIVLLHEAMTRLQAETRAAGKRVLFERIKNFLGAEPDSGEYAGIAKELGCTRGAVAIAVHRLRGRYRTLVLEEIAHTVAGPSEVDDELRCLFAALQ
ncbi:MAG: sigma-70 family RNA polymerase sigma factor [Verrucomicrobia bacterium]|nr:sigma-70 family RNA polymerase sigma factor [Verrucomicrobiota bacterium]